MGRGGRGADGSLLWGLGLGGWRFELRSASHVVSRRCIRDDYRVRAARRAPVPFVRASACANGRARVRRRLCSTFPGPARRRCTLLGRPARGVVFRSLARFPSGPPLSETRVSSLCSDPPPFSNRLDSSHRPKTIKTRQFCTDAAQWPGRSRGVGARAWYTSYCCDG